VRVILRNIKMRVILWAALVILRKLSTCSCAQNCPPGEPILLIRPRLICEKANAIISVVSEIPRPTDPLPTRESGRGGYGNNDSASYPDGTLNRFTFLLISS